MWALICPIFELLNQYLDLTWLRTGKQIGHGCKPHQGGELQYQWRPISPAAAKYWHLSESPSISQNWLSICLITIYQTPLSIRPQWWRWVLILHQSGGLGRSCLLLPAAIINIHTFLQFPKICTLTICLITIANIPVAVVGFNIAPVEVSAPPACCCLLLLLLLTWTRN